MIELPKNKNNFWVEARVLIAATLHLILWNIWHLKFAIFLALVTFGFADGMAKQLIAPWQLLVLISFVVLIAYSDGSTARDSYEHHMRKRENSNAAKFQRKMDKLKAKKK
jgi:hypothetical protein